MMMIFIWQRSQAARALYGLKPPIYRWSFNAAVSHSYRDISISGFCGHFLLSVVIEIIDSRISTVDYLDSQLERNKFDVFLSECLGASLPQRAADVRKNRSEIQGLNIVYSQLSLDNDYCEVL